MKQEYDVGDLIKLTACFSDPETGAPVDPEAVVCTVGTYGAGATDTVLSPNVDGSDGVYSATIAADRAGNWAYAFDGTGGHQASAEGTFFVRQRLIPR